MPTYCYTTDDGRTVERFYAMGDAPDCLIVGEEVATRDFQAEQCGRRPRNCGTWPMASYAAGVHPSQVPEMMERARAAGVPTEFTSDGDPVFTGPGHRKRYCELFNFFDRNAGLSDPTPK